MLLRCVAALCCCAVLLRLCCCAALCSHLEFCSEAAACRVTLCFVCRRLPSGDIPPLSVVTLEPGEVIGAAGGSGHNNVMAYIESGESVRLLGHLAGTTYVISNYCYKPGIRAI